LTENGVRIIWNILAALALTSGTLAWAHAVGAPVANPIGLSYSWHEAVLFSLPILGVILIVFYWISGEYAKLRSSLAWPHRVPVFLLNFKLGNSDIQPSSPGGKIFQGASVFLFYVLPIICLVVLGIQFFQRPIYCDQPEGLALKSATLVPSIIRPCASFFRYATQSGPQYYLYFSPWVYTILLIAPLLLCARVLSLTLR
jgi:hypothetical protein